MDPMAMPRLQHRDTGRVTAIDSGAFHNCAVGKRGTLGCAGDTKRSTQQGDYGQTSAPDIERHDHLAVGAYQSCVQELPEKNDPYESFQCWRGNQEAVSAFKEQLVPKDPAEADDNRSDGPRTGRIEAGGISTCVAIHNGEIKGEGVACWKNHPQASDRKDAELWVKRADDVKLDRQTSIGGPLWGGFSVGGAHRCLQLTDDDVGIFQCFGLGTQTGVWEGAGDYNQAAGPIRRDTTLRHPNNIALGERHSCVQGDRDSVCWGDLRVDRYAPANNESQSFVQGLYHGCWLEMGRIECSGRGTKPTRDEGDFDFDQAAPPSGKFDDLAAGRRYTCGIRREDNRVECWGNNERGQLDAPQVRFATIQAAELPPTVDGYGWTCGVTLDHAVHCWGARPDALATDSAPQSEGRPEVMRLSKLEQISGGTLHTCAVDKNGEAACWGNSRNKALAVPSRSSFQKLAAGHGFTCGLRDDATVSCWGSKAPRIDLMTMTLGELARGDAATDPPKGRYRQLVAGRSHACAIAFNGAIACWGRDRENQVDAPEGTGYIDLALGRKYSCALHESGEVECWGGEKTTRRRRRFGRAAEEKDEGDSKAPSRPTPPETRFSAIAGGSGHVCGIPEDGEGIECWGVSGESVPESGSFQALAVGAAHGCALADDGSITCWRSFEDESYSFGQASPPAGSFEQLSAGAYHTCATRPDGTGVCWGLGADLARQESNLDFNQGVTPSGTVEGM